MDESGRIDFPKNDTPEILPEEFKGLINIGKKELTIELFGVKWTLATLEEWEEREIEKRLNSFDIYTKERLRPIEVLTHSVMSVVLSKSSGLSQTWDFSYADKKPILRSVLLSVDPKVRYHLYLCYQVLAQTARNEFEMKYPNLEEKITEELLGKVGAGKEPQKDDIQERVPKGDVTQETSEEKK